MAGSLSTKHIPTLLGLFILGVGLVGGILLVNNTNTNSFLPRASAETTPRNLKITNVTDSSFTVSWVTDNKTPGYIRYGTQPSDLTQTITDDRDQISGSVGLFKTHHVTIRSLSPNTTYFFKVGTGTKELYDNSGTPYQGKTTGSSSGATKTLYGEVQNPDGTSANGALVYITSDNIAPLSALTQSSGSWVLSLANARSRDLRNAPELSATTTLTLLIVSSEDDRSSLITTTLDQSQPVPEIILGINKDFTQTESTRETPTAQLDNSTEQIQSKFSTQLLSPPTESVESTKKLAINYPSKENEVISIGHPEFIGSGPAGTSVGLALKGPSAQTTTASVSADGVWKYSPKITLKNGAYTLSATATIEGKKQTLTRTFSIDPHVVIPAFSTTASAQQNIANPTPTIHAITTPLPTSQSTRTPIPTTASVVPSESEVSYPSTESGEIISGTFEHTLFLFAGGGFLLGIGMYLYWQAVPKTNY